jgi:ankyrin repeat protein
MEALPRPPRADLAQYKKRAKDLVKAVRSADDTAVRAWAADWLHALAKALDTPITPRVESSMNHAIEGIERRVREAVRRDDPERAFALSDAQFLIATAHGFENWAAFTNHLDRSRTGDPVTRDFEAAADAVVNGDLATLQSLIKRDPSLLRAKSSREHRAMLLHYVAANGVEDFRQKTPKNAVDIARFLLESGAAPDGLANTYGGDFWQTTMNLLVSSAHPAGAGLMSPLVEVLLDFGAAVDGLKDDESPLFTALEFGYIDAAETLARRGARVDNVLTAAALGRLDLVKQYVVDARTLAPGVPLIAAGWRHLPADPTTHIALALVWACKFARSDVANFLLDLGVDPAATDGFKMTPLHWAAANGCMDVVKRLVAAKVPLEVENMWEGTVLDSTAHTAAYMPVAGVDYGAIFKVLVGAGADVSVLAPYPAGTKAIDDVRLAHGVPFPKPK